MRSARSTWEGVCWSRWRFWEKSCSKASSETIPEERAFKDGGIGGGIGQSPSGNGHVTFYVGTDDPQETLEKAEQLGGKTIMPVTELPQVTIALFADPEGHVVGLAKGM